MSTWLRQRRNSGRGFTMAELVMVCAILGILAALILPVAKFTIKRSKEASLRLSLREMRNAIDEYKRFSDSGLLVVELGTDGYPSDLEILVEGVDMVGQVRSRAKFLRTIPIDPMTGEADWGKRSYQDDFDSGSWGGESLYDVYSLSEGVGLDGVPYSQW